MLIMKVMRHLIASIKIIGYKVTNGNKVRFGKGFTFRKSFYLLIDKHGHVEIGSDCFFNNFCSITCLHSVSIGDGTIFGEGVKIYDHNHKFSNLNKTIKEQGFSIGSVHIGNHCWIGTNSVILKGADIGDNCVIGAGCVVSGKIPSNSIVKNADNYTIERIEEQ